VEAKEKDMKKIVIDARESGTTTGRYIDKYIEYLYKLKPKYDIVVLTKAHRVDYISRIAPKFTVVKTRYNEFGFGEQLGLAWQLYRLKADLVHFGMTQQPILYLKKTVTTIHDLTTIRFRNPAKNRVVFTIKQQVYKWVIKIAARKSAAVITGTEFVKDDIAKFAHKNSRDITVTYEAADVIPVSPKPIAELEDKQFLMYVGRPLPHKNLGRLIDAFVKLQEKHPELYLVLAGKKDSLYKRHERRIQRENINRVVFTDFVSEAELRWLYENCAAYVFPSLSEGFGLPGLEAMIHGAPVVSSNATCLPEVYGDAAEYFDPYNIDEMVKKINRVLTNEKRCKELVAAGKKQAKKYSWQRMAEQTLAVYVDILKEK
jgi:glycosyltransferase involved in cell wall biosynthesis